MPSELLHSPAAGTPRAEVLIVHGLGEHLGRYDALAADLNRWGYSVWRFNLRGHGPNPAEPQGDQPQIHSMLEDLAAHYDTVKARTEGRPIVILGHSLGGLIAARTVAGALRHETFGRSPDALVLSSPALDPGMSGTQKLMLAVGRRAFPHLRVSNGLKPEWVCSDPAVVKAYVEDPWVHDRVSATVAAMVADGGAEVIEDAPKWYVPTLLMWAGMDRCVNPAGSAAFAAGAIPKTVHPHCFTRMSHEIFNEPDREQATALLRNFLDRRYTTP